VSRAKSGAMIVSIKAIMDTIDDVGSRGAQPRDRQPVFVGVSELTTPVSRSLVVKAARAELLFVGLLPQTGGRPMIRLSRPCAKMG